MGSQAEVGLNTWIAGGDGAPLAARQLVTAELGEILEEETLYDLLLLTTELVTNAVVHAGVDETRMLELQVGWDGPLLHVSVFDPGGESDPHVKQPDLDVPGGVGLFLVEQLSSRWGVERGRDGATQVWFELPTARVPVGDLAGHRIELTPVVHSEPRAVAIVTSSAALN